MDFQADGPAPRGLLAPGSPDERGGALGRVENRVKDLAGEGVLDKVDSAGADRPWISNKSWQGARVFNWMI